MDQNGVLNLKVIEQEAPSEIRHEMKNLVGRCSSIGGADSCEKAFRQSKCLVAEMKVLESEYARKLLIEQEEWMKTLETTSQAHVSTVS